MPLEFHLPINQIQALLKTSVREMDRGKASAWGAADRDGSQLHEAEKKVHERHGGRTKVDSRAVDRPHFFKIILSSTLRDGKLGIPKRFVRLYGEYLSSDTVVLKVPDGKDGKVWQVGLVRSQSEVWLERGWRELVEYYGFEHGHFLVFRLEGDCSFHLLILDRTATEIQYPSTTGPSYGEWVSLPPPMTEIEQDTSVEILDPGLPETVEVDSDDSVSVGPYHVPPTGQNPKMKRRLSSGQPKKKRNDSSSRRTGNHTSNVRAAEVKFAKPEIGSSSRPGTSGRKAALERSCNVRAAEVKFVKPETGSSSRPGTSGRKAALERARLFMPQNPFFISKMPPSSVNGVHGLHVPLWFANRYLKMAEKHITLLGSDGRRWPATYFRATKCAEIFSGWRRFAEENLLKRDDVCVVELMESPEILLKVHIFRNEEVADALFGVTAVGV